MSEESRDDMDFSAKGSLADLMATFAGVLLVLASLFDIVQGLSAVHDDALYAAGSDYLFRINVTAWGWIHIVTGVVGIPVAIGILMRKGWGQVAGMVVASLSILANFTFLPVYPVWASFIIAFNLAVIWALSVQHRNYR
jgi:hypothetical protein